MIHAHYISIGGLVHGMITDNFQFISAVIRLDSYSTIMTFHHNVFTEFI